ncbi:MAG TPA: hypothetical protein VF502_07680, partial [Stellaceae bacterium]
MSNVPLFDSYLMVDWSAASQPARGKDSIWLCHMRRDGRALRTLAVENLATRHEARQRLLSLLDTERGAGRAVLAGFDFAFGYPSGLAQRLQLPDPPWRSMWDLLADRMKDEADNSNNRFAVAAALNERISGGPAPFWGCPSAAAHPSLETRHHRRHEALGLAERRLADARIRGPQPVWKLAYPGSVGSQVLTGIPVLRYLRDHGDLAAATWIWPFETGLRPLARADTEGRILLAKIYPSLVPALPRPGEVRDACQVRAIARHFAALDAAGGLAPLFAGDPTLSDAERRRVEGEESWILGVTGASEAATRYAYLRDPEEIY